jgi:glycine/D-amino acid oxidase-like deaminating enzyme
LVFLPNAFLVLSKMIHTEYLIIGQGMAGTLLSRELISLGKSVLVIDAPNNHKASLVASAVINPLVGKSWTLANDAENKIPIALETYQSLHLLLGADLLSQKSIIVFHRDEEGLKKFVKQKASGNTYLKQLTEEEDKMQKTQWNIQYGVGKVEPVYTVDAKSLLIKWKNYLLKNNSFIEDTFLFEDLKTARNTIRYKDISADKIVFCEGAVGRKNPFFPSLNFTKNRGDVLLLSIPELSLEYIYHKNFRLVPREDGLFWCGSNYIWEYNNLDPNLDWRKDMERQLKGWLKLPFQIIEHAVAERPTTAGQQSLLLQSTEYKNIFFFNGMGTRGFSAGPSLAQRMVSILNR